MRLPLIVALFVLPDMAQDVPVRRLGAPQVEFPEPFRAIDDLRVLPSGDVLVTAARASDITRKGLVVNRRLYAVSFAAGSVRAIGEQGSGPNQYSNVGPLLQAPGDTTWMPDEAQARMFVIGSGGEVVGNAPIPPHVIPEKGEATYYLRFMRTDAAGNFFDLRFAPAPDRPLSYQDSVVLRHRGNRLRPVTDTIAWLYRTIRRTPSKYLGSVGLPYSLQDKWAVTPNGDVIIVRADEYRVDRVSPSGAMSHGAPIRYERRAVTPRERDEYIAAARASYKSARMQLPDPGPDLENAQWPAFKPPFTGEVVLAEDCVWVPITPRTDADSIVYDVVAFDGTLRERVAMPPATVVIGFGPGVVFAVRRAKEALYLGRWAWPPKG